MSFQVSSFSKARRKIGTNRERGSKNRKATPSTNTLNAYTPSTFGKDSYFSYTKFRAILFPGLPSRIRTKENFEIKSCIFTRAKFRGQILLAYSVFSLQDSQSIPKRFPSRSELF